MRKNKAKKKPMTQRPKVGEPNPDYGKSKRGDPEFLLDALPEEANPVRGETASDPGTAKRRA